MSDALGLSVLAWDCLILFYSFTSGVMAQCRISDGNGVYSRPQTRVMDGRTRTLESGWSSGGLGEMRKVEAQIEEGAFEMTVSKPFESETGGCD